MNAHIKLMMFIVLSSFIIDGMERKSKKRKRFETRQEQAQALPKTKKSTFESWKDLPIELQSLILTFVPLITDYKSFLLLWHVDSRFKEIVDNPLFFEIFIKRLLNFNADLAYKVLKGAVENGQLELVTKMVESDERLKADAQDLMLNALYSGNDDEINILKQAGIVAKI